MLHAVGTIGQRLRPVFDELVRTEFFLTAFLSGWRRCGGSGNRLRCRSGRVTRDNQGSSNEQKRDADCPHARPPYSTSSVTGFGESYKEVEMITEALALGSSSTRSSADVRKCSECLSLSDFLTGKCPVSRVVPDQDLGIVPPGVIVSTACGSTCASFSVRS